jgi:hypothetical protein
MTLRTRAGEQLRSQWAGFLALFLVLAGGGAYAAFDPIGADGDIDACYAKRTGDLDLLKGRHCSRNEKAIAWSAVGPRGETGAVGPQGPKGDAGVAGSPAASMLLGRVDASLMPADSTNTYVPSGEASTTNKALQGSAPNSAVVLRDLFAEVGAAPGVGATWTIAVGVYPAGPGDPRITCQIGGAFAERCNSGGQTATIPPGSEIVLRVESANAAPNHLRYGYRAVSP